MSHIDVISVQNLGNIVDRIFEMSWFKTCFIAIGMVWASLFEGQHQIMAIIPLMIILDAITGFMSAWIRHDIDSSYYYKSPLKAFIYLIFVVVARAVDMVSPGDYFTYMMNFFIVSTEAISVLENISKMGLPVPTMLFKRLKRYQDELKKDS